MAAMTWQQWLSKANVADQLGSQFDAQVSSIANNQNPNGAPAGNIDFIEANLRARGILAWRQYPGDCGRPSQQKAPSGTQIVAAGSKAIPVIGSLVSSVLGAFGAHHAAAVQNEQNTICDIATQANNVIPMIDALVYEGQIDAQTAASYMNQTMQPLIQELGSIVKQCNAACVYQSVCRAHIEFAKIYYPILSGGTQVSNASNPTSVYPGTQIRQLPAGTTGPGLTVNPIVNPNNLVPVQANALNLSSDEIYQSSWTWAFVLLGAVAAVIIAFVAMR